MAQFSARRTLSLNFSLDGKDKFAGAAPTEGNNTPIILYASTFALAIAFATALSSMARYLKDDFSRSLRPS